MLWPLASFIAFSQDQCRPIWDAFLYLAKFNFYLNPKSHQCRSYKLSMRSQTNWFWLVELWEFPWLFHFKSGFFHSSSLIFFFLLPSSFANPALQSRLCFPLRSFRLFLSISVLLVQDFIVDFCSCLLLRFNLLSQIHLRFYSSRFVSHVFILCVCVKFLGLFVRTLNLAALCIATHTHAFLIAIFLSLYFTSIVHLKSLTAFVRLYLVIWVFLCLLLFRRKSATFLAIFASIELISHFLPPPVLLIDFFQWKRSRERRRRWAIVNGTLALSHSAYLRLSSRSLDLIYTTFVLNHFSLSLFLFCLHTRLIIFTFSKPQTPCTHALLFCSIFRFSPFIRFLTLIGNENDFIELLTFLVSRLAFLLTDLGLPFINLML